MKVHYLSCHSILEYDEVQILTDLGHDVFANGSYLDPAGHVTLPRPGINGAKMYHDYVDIALNHPKTNLPMELIDPFDVIIVMHSPNIIINNWDKLKHKKVIWRTIGQSTRLVEDSLKPMRDDGLKIIRYSPNERRISNYIGEDVLIRFYKDENDFQNWNGKNNNVVNFSQSLKGRRDHCHYDEIFPVIEKFNGMVYGPGNEDLGQYNGGAIPYHSQIHKMQTSKAMIYGGTAPASYTLSFIEALMMGLPIVSIGDSMANIIYDFNFYECEDILKQCNGIVCNSVEEMIDKTSLLLDDNNFAEQISVNQRELAIDMFGKSKIIKQWEDFLNGI